MCLSVKHYIDFWPNVDCNKNISTLASTDTHDTAAIAQSQSTSLELIYSEEILPLHSICHQYLCDKNLYV